MVEVSTKRLLLTVTLVLYHSKWMDPDSVMKPGGHSYHLSQQREEKKTDL